MENSNFCLEDASEILKMLLKGKKAAYKRISSELDEEKCRLIRTAAQEIRVDFDKVSEIINMLEDNGLAANENDYQQLFYAVWLRTASSALRKRIEDGLKERDRFYLTLREYVLGMGSKFKAVKSGLLCVSPTIPLVCAECYFLKVCPSPLPVK